MKVRVSTNDGKHYEIWSEEQEDGTFEAIVLPVHGTTLRGNPGHMRVKFGQWMTSQEQAVQNGIVLVAIDQVLPDVYNITSSPMYPLSIHVLEGHDA